MDPSQPRGRSPSVPGHQPPPHIKNSHSPSPARPFNPADASSIGLGIDLDSSSGQQFPGASEFPTFNPGGTNFLDSQRAQPFPGDTSFGNFDPSNGIDDLGGFDQQQQADFTNDFTIFPPATTGEEQLSAPLFVGDPGLGQPITSPDNMLAQASPHMPTPPHMLKLEPQSGHHSPSFSQHQFVPSPGHSRNVSLGPQAALLPGQDWSQFRSHRRTPSEYSESSVGIPSPNLGVSDTFDHGDPNRSPMQSAQDPTVIQELHGIGSFSISDQARSPSHSPAVSPRIVPEQIPDMNHNYTLGSNGFVSGPPQPYGLQAAEAFPSLPQTSDPSYPPAPTINIVQAPPMRNNFDRNNFDGRSPLDADALTIPDRGRSSPPSFSSLHVLTHEIQVGEGSEPSLILTTTVPWASGRLRLPCHRILAAIFRQAGEIRLGPCRH